MCVGSLDTEIEIVSEGHLKEDDFDQHLRLGTIQTLNDILHLEVGVVVRDDNDFPRFGIDGNHGFAHIGAARVFAGCGTQSSSARGPSSGSSKLPLLLLLLGKTL